MGGFKLGGLVAHANVALSLLLGHLEVVSRPIRLRKGPFNS
jgi:hypothetical protein